MISKAPLLAKWDTASAGQVFEGVHSTASAPKSWPHDWESMLMSSCGSHHPKGCMGISRCYQIVRQSSVLLNVTG